MCAAWMVLPILLEEGAVVRLRMYLAFACRSGRSNVRRQRDGVLRPYKALKPDGWSFVPQSGLRAYGATSIEGLELR